VLKTFENRLIYFGDFDLAGIGIYLNEIKVRNNNIELFIPKDIEELLNKFGSSKLYKKHYSKYKNLKSSDKTIQNLIDTIHKEQKSLEQEWFLG